MFVLSAMATKVKVTKSMLHTLDYQNRGRRQCSQHKIAFICSLIVGISGRASLGWLWICCLGESDHCALSSVKRRKGPLLVQWLLYVKCV